MSRATSFIDWTRICSVSVFVLGATRTRRYFLPLSVLSTATLFILFMSTSFNYIGYYQVLTFDRYECISCGDGVAASSKEIIYDEQAIFDKYVGTNNSKITSALWKRIRPAMTTAEKRTLRVLLRSFSAIADSFNFTYFMISGTLLGSYRHHGLMPWDDDVDVLMRYEERSEILKQFRNSSNLNDTIQVEVGPSKRMKVFHRYQRIPVRGWRYSWPTVDVSFYKENATHIWECNGEKKFHVIPKIFVFPLHPRPFETLMLKSPFDAFGVLHILYRDPTCVTLSWVHKTERHPGPVMRFDCEITSRFYPFVHRSVVEKNLLVEESLVIDGKVIYSLVVDEPLYAITKPYILQMEPVPALATRMVPDTEIVGISRNTSA